MSFPATFRNSGEHPHRTFPSRVEIEHFLQSFQNNIPSDLVQSPPLLWWHRGTPVPRCLFVVDLLPHWLLKSLHLNRGLWCVVPGHEIGISTISSGGVFRSFFCCLSVANSRGHFGYGPRCFELATWLGVVTRRRSCWVYGKASLGPMWLAKSEWCVFNWQDCQTHLESLLTPQFHPLTDTSLTSKVICKMLFNKLASLSVILTTKWVNRPLYPW